MYTVSVECSIIKKTVTPRRYDISVRRSVIREIFIAMRGKQNNRTVGLAASAAIQDINNQIVTKINVLVGQLISQ